MKSPQINKYIYSFILPILLVTLLIPNYFVYARSMPFQFWDEVDWVGRSYYYEFYSLNELNNPIWKEYEAYDQPSLTKLLFGLWLSQRFSSEINHNVDKSYTSFLLQNGFPTMRYDLITKYTDNPSIEWLEEDTWIDSYTFSDLDNKSIVNVTALRMIYDIRILNIFILAISVVFAYYLAIRFMHPFFGFTSALFYGANLLIVQSSILAHAEALFLLTFNASLLFLFCFFHNTNNIRYLFLFAIFTGLCASTKLNGFMLIIVFLIVYLALLRLNYISNPSLMHVFLPFVISYLVFIALNPYTYSSPFTGIIRMFAWRIYTANQSLPEHQTVPSQLEIVYRIFHHFFTDPDKKYFFGQMFSVTFPFIHNLIYVSVFGFIYMIYQVIKGNKEAVIAVLSFLTVLVTMSFYLILDWDRYYVPLVLFFSIFLFILISAFAHRVFRFGLDAIVNIQKKLLG